MTRLKQLLEWLPVSLCDVLERLPEPVRERLEEIRIREGRPLEIGYETRSAFVTPEGAETDDPRLAWRPDRDVCRALLERITRHSLYAMEEELRLGYITVPGGHRIGLAGRTVLENGAVRRLRDVAGFNVRVARERIGCSAGVLPGILDLAAQTVRHTLIVSPPQQGKTTLLRDLARAVSAGDWRHPAARGWRGRKVGVVDERSEIAACEGGVPTFDLGPRCDVLDACPKAEGVMMLIRSMSPEVVVVDEIGRPEDAAALREALNAGVRVVATAHAAGIDDVLSRPVLRQLAAEGLFHTYVILSRSAGRITHRIVTAEEALAGRTRRQAPRSGMAPRDAPGSQEFRATAVSHPGVSGFRPGAETANQIPCQGGNHG